MLDTTTYLLTQHNPGGPIVRNAEPLPHEMYATVEEDLPLTRGRLIGGVLSLCMLIGVGVYLFVSL